jgi:predicted enzyme related to lactoylglutathione lyase
MLKIRGIYEIAIPVRELSRAETFYRNVLGLEVGLRDETRKWLFLRAGGDAGMIVLQETPEEWHSQHFAFAVSDAELDEAAAGKCRNVESSWMDPTCATGCRPFGVFQRCRRPST